MRTSNDSTSLKALSSQNNQVPWRQFMLEETLLKFSLQDSASPTYLASVPLVMTSTDANHAILLAGFYNNAVYLKTATANVASTLVSGGTNIGASCLHGSWAYVSSEWRFYHSNGTSIGYRPSSNFGSFNSVGSLSGVSLSDNGSNFVKRVEAVCYTPSGIVSAIGSHDTTKGLSTIEFQVVISGTAYKLKNILQCTHSESYQAASAAPWPWAAHVSAFEISSGVIQVIACDNSRAWQFTITNGVESSMEMVIPIDLEISDVKFRATNAIKVASGWLMSGWFERTMKDASSQHLEQYLTSTDGRNWSMGELSSFISTDGSKCAFVQPLSNTNYIYSIGNGKSYRAAARPFDNGSVATDISANVLQYQIGSQENGTGGGSLAVANTFSEAQRVTFTLGYKDASGNPIYAQIGRFMLDDYGKDYITAEGVPPDEAPIVDEASWRVKEWLSPFDGDYWSKTTVTTDFKKADKVTVKTPQRDAEFSAGSGLVYSGLNTPFIAYAADRDDRDSVLRATVKFATTDGKAQQLLAFVFGGSKDKFNAIVIPAYCPAVGGAGWSPRLAKPVLAKSNLDPTNLFNVSENQASLLTTSLSGQYDKMMIAISDSDSGASHGDWQASLNVDYEFAAHILGGEIRLYARQSTSVAFVLVGQWRVTEKFAGKFGSYFGIACNTDTWCSLSALEDAAYEDIEQTLTRAGNYATFPGDYSRFLYSITMGNAGGARTDVHLRTDIHGNVPFTGIAVGNYIRVVVPSHDDRLRKVVAIDNVNHVLTIDEPMAFSVNGADGSLYGLANYDSWGYADCGKRDYVATAADELGDLSMPINPGAQKVKRPLRGRAAFVSDDSTALSIRMVESDGSRFELKTGSPDTGVAWDAVNPIDKADDPYFWSGSAPQGWRAMLYQGYVFDGEPLAIGMPNDGYIKVGDEIMRYHTFSFTSRDGVTVKKWAIVPAFYTPLAAQGAGYQAVRQWRSTAGAMPGDRFDTIQANFGVNPVGLLVDVTSRNSGYNPSDEQHYCTYTSVEPGALTKDNTPYIQLDKVLKVAVRGANPDLVLADGEINPALAGTQQEGDMCVLSGRGQFGTTKTMHDPNAPVVYYPSSTKLDSLITIKRFSIFSGIHKTTEDMLKKVCAMSGVHSPTFASRDSATISSSEKYFNCIDSDFLFEYTGVLASGAAGFNLAFRSYYGVWLKSSGANVDIVLHAPSSDVALSSGLRVLESITVPIYSFGNSGDHTVRILVKQYEVSVEIDGRLVHSFDLECFPAYKVRMIGTVTGGWMSSGSWTSGTAISARLPALGDEHENLIVAMGDTGEKLIGDIVQDRHIYFYPNSTGGYKFTRNDARDDLGTYSDALFDFISRYSQRSRPGHILVSGAEFGEYVDNNMALTGYRFGVGQNRFLMTVSDSRREAQLQVRLGQEQAEAGQANGPAMPLWEPGDKVTLSMSNPGDVPDLSYTAVIVSAEFAGDNVISTGSYSFKKYVA